jgi:Asp-tRNA(Asn)/Glu-tRNA(Gln) amidotransferase A subunit family amidase
MPVGLQVVGPQGQDARTIANAGWVERALLREAGALPIGVGA